ncbi:MAG TPA: chromosome segregation protein SMC [Anaerolineae bacterium]|nr:chromosome segregation protein SMC [Anaerolineae bacterium]HPL27400.1 chromosome segregation protein SMC [Anaerolineae bacterium]
MYLKRLEIQGYKSFAGRADFGFNDGITAIVGPNGSGKSNIADAVRWALGEQSYSALRAKRTEDLIFSGSAQRARMGLAEVSLVFDNSTQWLPLEYAEVTITRRAYRSGENEYYLNGSRVRLRDIGELLTRAGLGRNASVVIGQGQVDAALSLRPEERRSLFEEAAGVRIYIDKRDEALARLDETRRNLERLNDIIGEIAPRLESLRRQAERTHEHNVARQQLDVALLQWYGYQWQRQQDRVAQVGEKLRRQDEHMQQQRDRLQQIVADREALRARQQASRDDIGRRRRQADRLRGQFEEQRRQLAVMQERTQARARQQEQVRADLAGVEARRRDILATVERQTQELDALGATIAAQQTAASAAQAQLVEAEAALRLQREELERARSAAFEVATAQAAARNRLAQLHKRSADVAQEAAEHRAALTDAEAKVETARHDMEAAEARHQEALTALGQAEAALHQAEDSLAASLSRLDQFRAERDAAREAHQRLRTQYDVLQRARSQGSHLYEGAQAVINEHMPGVLGTVASLIQVPVELEAAMEVALGGHLQDVVVKTWNDALACIDLLKRRDRGRATFLPLDYVRPPRSIPVPNVPGVHGVAATLVKASAEYRGICELLLGNIVIVDGLPAARKALAAEPRLGRAVTIEGDVVEARGVVRGGSRPRSRGYLAQEREWRELPGQLAQAQQALAAVEAQTREEDSKQQDLRRQVRELGQRLQSARSALTQEQQRAGSLRQRHDRLAQELSWRRSQADQSARVVEELESDLAQVQGELASLELSVAEATQRVETLRTGAEDAKLEELRRRAAECETALAVSQRSKQAQEQFMTTQREALARAGAEAQARQANLQRLDQEAAALVQELEAANAALAELQQMQHSLTAPLAGAEAELQSLEQQLASLEAEDEQARQQMQALQTEANRLSFEQERALEALEEVRRQVEAELGPIEPPDVGQPRQLRLNLGNGATPLPHITDLPEGLGQQVKDLRALLRRLGPVNPAAPAEYEEVLQRHRFLADQIQDLTKAAEATREVTAELNRVIRERFGRSFARIAREFSDCFSTLFNGGSAKLLLTEPDNPADSGIEIIARPPGKRAQSLALLSGGERALTATSLLFALLKVNPLPFCVLDEVDAMLDEANVHRFRTFLESLAQQTQFVVITHNRNTVEAASTIYGISMAREGVSQVLSLKLPDKAGDKTAASPAA